MVFKLYEVVRHGDTSLLHIVALIVFMEESGIITIWTELSVMERMVSISNSWHVFWGINHFCIVGCQEV
jgi:hypothetical protein